MHVKISQVLVAAFLLAAGTVRAQTTIVVDTGTDLDPDSTRFTCTFTQGVFVSPAPDGKCTLRRAMLEASARPDVDRPITITFVIPTTDPSYDSDLEIWYQNTTRPLPTLIGSAPGTAPSQITLQGPTRSAITGGPSVFVELDSPIEIRDENNTIVDIGLVGEAGVSVRGDRNVLQGLTLGLAPDGETIQPRTPGDPARGGFSAITIAGDENIVRDSAMAGAFSRAIRISSGAENQILDNFIGTRMDGTIPSVPPSVECRASMTPDPQDWLGGWGLSITGEGNLIAGNVIAGLQTVRATNDTPPIAIELFGNSHVVENNRIGLDATDTPVGVCGQAINFSGIFSQIRFNEIARSRPFGDSEPVAAILGTGSIDGVTIVSNTVVGSPGQLIAFADSAGAALQDFLPPEIRSIEPTLVTGIEEAAYPCPDCRVDLYLDNLDENEDALEWLGRTTTNAEGEFMFNLARPLTNRQGLRTTATTNDANVIAGQAAGATSQASQLFVPVVSDIIFNDGFERRTQKHATAKTGE